MSKETMVHLNTHTLIGFTDKRGKAWHYRADLQGAEPNHYTGAIPVADVQRRLFAWQAVPRRVAVEFPATFETMTHLNDAGEPVRWAVQQNRQAISPSNRDVVMGLFKDGYKIHQYDAWLLDNVATILDDDLSISSAGLLRDGALAQRPPRAASVRATAPARASTRSPTARSTEPNRGRTVARRNAPAPRSDERGREQRARRTTVAL